MDEPGTPAERLYALIGAYRLSEAISVAAALGIADALADGDRTIDALAARTQTDAGALYRLLRALAAAGVLSETPDRSFALTGAGTFLRSDVPGTLRDWAIFVGRPQVREGWGNLEHTIRTGENAFTALHGESVWDWRKHEPAEDALFNRAMVSNSATVATALADAYDFRAARTVADIGGGSGTLLAAILGRHPGLRGVLFDQPHVVSSPATTALLERAGVLDRSELAGGSFFEAVPAGIDVYVLKAVLHDWDDDDAIRILRTVRAAASPESVLLVIEAVIGPPNTDLRGKLSDLHMAVMPGGRERTEGEWRALLLAGGFALSEIRPLVMGWRLLIA